MASAGWAESINQIFEEDGHANKNTLVLSKSTTTKRPVKEKSLGFEIDNEQPVVKQPPTEQELKDITSSKERRLNKKRKFELLKTLRVQPDVRDRNRELTLKRVATKGVVQLFNAVQTQQRTLKKQVDAEKIDSKREDILNNINKKTFLNVLMGGAKSVLIDNPVKKEKRGSDSDEEEDEEPVRRSSTKESTWNVLKDNFMNSSKKKASAAWDEDEESDEGEMEND